MGYKRAEEVLPRQVLEQVWQYVDGEILYIPRKGEKRDWGADTDTKRRLETRNADIYEKYRKGKSIDLLAEEFYLSSKSIQRIIRNAKGKT